MKSLPDSCVASADALQSQRAVFEDKGVFSPQLIDGIITKLKSYDDASLRDRLTGSTDEMLKVVRKYWHCG